MITEQNMKEKDAIAKKDGFSDWMNQPATRMMLSMIPPADKAEIIETLLQETYNAGYAKGAGQTAVSFFEAMFKNMERKER